MDCSSSESSIEVPRNIPGSSVSTGYHDWTWTTKGYTHLHEPFSPLAASAGGGGNDGCPGMARCSTPVIASTHSKQGRLLEKHFRQFLVTISSGNSQFTPDLPITSSTLANFSFKPLMTSTPISLNTAPISLTTAQKVVRCHDTVHTSPIATITDLLDEENTYPPPHYKRKLREDPIPGEETSKPNKGYHGYTVDDVERPCIGEVRSRRMLRKVTWVGRALGGAKGKRGCVTLDSTKKKRGVLTQDTTNNKRGDGLEKRKGRTQSGVKEKKGGGTLGGTKEKRGSGTQGGVKEKRGGGTLGGIKEKRGSGTKGGVKEKRMGGAQGGVKKKIGDRIQDGVKEKREGGIKGRVKEKSESGTKGGVEEKRRSGAQGGVKEKRGDRIQDGVEERRGGGSKSSVKGSGVQKKKLKSAIVLRMQKHQSGKKKDKPKEEKVPLSSVVHTAPRIPIHPDPLTQPLCHPDHSPHCRLGPTYRGRYGRYLSQDKVPIDILTILHTLPSPPNKGM